ncbi:hypothetical protein Vadar_021421 [Vaccinium darrowii]|uniref:Uncharacterized protein n=1 Tax=Vaccinium darrowii TaxID=229202 RepID=A0ACB7ZDA6_9ERIC|nr:hypothetical protein Vadar_021421 [Vaccinium darrowii]
MFGQSTSSTFNGGINVAFINITSYTILQQQRPKPKPTPRHNVFAFLIPALFNFLDLEYQGNGIVSPFQTHPKTMCVALVCLLSYYTAYEAEKEPRFTQLGRLGMRLFGSILAVSLASVLCQNSVSCVVCFLYVLFSNREMLSAGIDFFWNWIQQKSTSDPLQEIRLINRLCYICPSLFTGEPYSQCNSLDGS